MLRLCVIRRAANKKFLKLKCTDCTRLLPVNHFNHAASVLHGVDKLVCLTCKKYCVHCGQLQPRSQFPDHPDQPASHSGDAFPAVSTDIYGEPIYAAGSSGTTSSSGRRHGTGMLGELNGSSGDNLQGQSSVEWCTSCIGKRHAAETNVYFRFPVLKYRSCPFSVDRYREVIEEERTQKQDLGRR
jgi:hypothetical protein